MLIEFKVLVKKCSKHYRTDVELTLHIPFFLIMGKIMNDDIQIEPEKYEDLNFVYRRD